MSRSNSVSSSSVSSTDDDVTLDKIGGIGGGGNNENEVEQTISGTCWDFGGLVPGGITLLWSLSLFWSKEKLKVVDYIFIPVSDAKSIFSNS